jgi:predicted nucleic acid-binding protein
MSVFADTSALYASIVRTEGRHRESLNVFQKLIESGRSLKTTSYVLLETTALLV